ncbi:MAG: hypothetical protein E7353_07535 [Clostridiales bacterium]|nr:hypothetical protein [Clostridiales bacterium]
MAKKKSIKTALVMALVSIVACLSMFAGTTFAWFTDSVTSSKNVIKAGTLDAEMYWASATADPLADDTEWKDASKVAIFDYDNWEPGYTDAKHVKIANAGSLSFKYEVRIEANGEVSELADVIDVYFADPAVQLSGRNAISTVVGTLDDVLQGDYVAKGELVAGDDVVVTILLKMREEAGNEYQDLSIGSTFSVKVIATQMSYESDSFSPDYDEDASVNEAIFGVGGTVNLTEDFNREVNVEKDVDVTLNLNNNVVTEPVNNEGNLEVNEGTIQATVTNTGNLEINDGVIEVEGRGLETTGNATLNDVTINAGSPASYSNISLNNAVTEYNNVEIVSAGGGVGAADGAKVIFNSGKVEINSTSTSGRYNFYTEGAGSEITINGGDFSFSSTLNQKRAYIYAGAGTTVYVKGGNFGVASTRKGYTDGILTASDSNGENEGKVIITGGTFKFDPTKWVADGYTAVKDGDTWTVGPYEVATTDELVAMLKDAKYANGLVVTLKAGTYDGLSFINPSNYVAKNVTIIGEEGAVINGFAINGWSVDNNIVIDGLTFKNVTFAQSLSLSTKSMANVTVEDCDFINDACVLQNDKTEKLTNLVIKNCTFTGVTDGGTTTAIMLENTENVSVTGCTFTNIDFNVMQTGIVSGNVVFDGNKVNGTGDRVFRFVTVDSATIAITNNTIVSDGDADGELAKSSNACTIKLENNTWNGKADAEVLDKLINITPAV